MMLRKLVFALAFVIAARADGMCTVQKAWVGTSGGTIFATFNDSAGKQAIPRRAGELPSITVNGERIELASVWCTGRHACIGYLLPGGKRIQPGDKVTITAAAGWVDTTAGPAAALKSRFVENHTGASAFGTETLAHTLKMGLNLPHLGTMHTCRYQVLKNWRYRLSNFRHATLDRNGRPVETMATRADATLYDTAHGINGLDQTTYPGLPGLFAIGWDDLAPSQPTTFSICSYDPETTTVTERTDLANSGDAIGRGKVRVFDVHPTASSKTVNLSLGVVVENEARQPRFKNLVIYAPGDFTYQAGQPTTLDRSDPFALSATTHDRWKYGLGSLRCMDSTISFGGFSSVTEPEELFSLRDLSWGEGVNRVSRVIHYTQLRPFNPQASFTIFTDLAPGGQVKINSIDEIVGPKDQIFEVVSQDPHGLKTGQPMSFDGKWPVLKFKDGSIHDITYYKVPAIVTGPNTFIAEFHEAKKGPTTLSSPIDLDPQVSRTDWNLPGPGFPYELTAIMAGKLDGCDLHVAIPMMGSDRLIDDVARRIRDNFPAGRHVYVELCNEPWNGMFVQYETFHWLSALVFPGEERETWYVVRSGQVWARFRSIFGPRADEVIGMLNTQFANPDASRIVLRIARAKGVKVGAIGVAPYVVPDESPSSIAAWNLAEDDQAVDLWITDLRLNVSVHGFSTFASGHHAFIAEHNAKSGDQTVLYGYEGGIESAVPHGARDELKRTRDIVYHPNWRIIEQDFYAWAQNSGFVRFNIYAYAMVYFNNANWAIYHGIGQPHGAGDGSDGKADNRLCRAVTKPASVNQDQSCVSVRGQAFLDWNKAVCAQEGLRKGTPKSQERGKSEESHQPTLNHEPN
jgi:hypothetical protein